MVENLIVSLRPTAGTHVRQLPGSLTALSVDADKLTSWMLAGSSASRSRQPDRARSADRWCSGEIPRRVRDVCHSCVWRCHGAANPSLHVHHRRETLPGREGRHRATPRSSQGNGRLSRGRERLRHRLRQRGHDAPEMLQVQEEHCRGGSRPGRRDTLALPKVQG